MPKWSETELYSPLYGFIKTFNRSIQGIATWNSREKSQLYHVSKIAQLDWSKTAKQFSVNSGRKFLSLSGKQATRKASAWPAVFLSQNFRYFPVFWDVISVKYTVIFVLGTCLMDFEQLILIFTEVWPYNFDVSQ